MPIEFACSCGQRVRVSDRQAGKKGICPRCGTRVTIPASWKSKDPVRIDKSELGADTVVRSGSTSESRMAQRERQTSDDTTEPFRPGEMRANRRMVGKVCPICQSHIEIGERVKVCEYCRLPAHLSCWVENEGCATYGCEAGPSPKPIQADVDLGLDGANLGTGAERLRRAPEIHSGLEFHRQRLAIVCSGSVGIIATFLPWVKMPIVGAIDGSAGDGWITLGLFLVTILVGCVGDKKNALVGGALLAAICPAGLAGLIGVWKVIDFKSMKAGLDNEGALTRALAQTVQLGIGLYLVIIAAAVLIILAFALQNSGPTRGRKAARNSSGIT